MNSLVDGGDAFFSDAIDAATDLERPEDTHFMSAHKTVRADTDQDANKCVYKIAFLCWL